MGRASGVKVKGYGHSCKVKGKSGVDHQIDVLTEHSDGIHSYQTAIECKYWDKKINKDIVMKVSETIEDAGISKGVIVSRSGFTPDGIEFAKYKNIGLVELRETNGKDLEKRPEETAFGILELRLKISTTRPEISSIEIEPTDDTQLEKRFIDASNTFHIIIELPNGNRVALNYYVREFQRELGSKEKLQTLTKRYDFSGATLIDQKNNSSVKIKGIVFTGELKKQMRILIGSLHW